MNVYPWFVLLLLLLIPACSSNDPAQASNLQASYANQLSLATNACGPTALINSLRSGDAACQAAAARIPGESDQQKLRHIILKYCAKQSRHIPGHLRWSIRGINAADLTDVANEIHPSSIVSFVHPASTHKLLLKHAQRLLATSLKSGFSPIVGIRRYKDGVPVDSHYLTIIAVDAIDLAEPQRCGFTYVDPAGGLTFCGTLSVDSLEPRFLVASIPQSSFAKKAHPHAKILMDAMILRR